jgi:glycosyltransferase involved in cell wall biosynthesis
MEGVRRTASKSMSVVGSRAEGVRPIRVLELVTSTAGGAGWHVLRLALGIQRRAFHVSVAFGLGYPLDKRFGEVGLHTCPVTMRRNLSPLQNIFAFFQILALLRRQRFDILHTHCSMAGFLGRIAGRLAGVPVIVHTLHALASRDNQAPWKQRVYLAIERWLDGCTDQYVAVSAAMGRQVVEKRIADRRHVTVIHHGLDLDPYLQLQGSRGKRRQLGLHPTCLVVGMVGRLEPQKGVEYLVDAMPRLCALHEDARVLIIGDGPLRQSLENRATRRGVHDRVRFLGWRTDVPEILAELDVFCMPSLWESLGYSILEAMACGVPVVASDVEGIPEVVVHGETGLLVPPGDPSALAEAISLLLDRPDLRCAMGRAGQKRVEQRFSERMMLDRYEQMYLDLSREADRKGRS